MNNTNTTNTYEERPERLPKDVSTVEMFRLHCVTRALQGLHDGYEWDGVVREAHGMKWARFTRLGLAYPLLSGVGTDNIKDVLVEASSQSKAVDGTKLEPPIVFKRGDQSLLTKMSTQGVTWSMAGGLTSKSMIDTSEYQLIEAFYGTKKAVRSKVPLMNHIDEGLAILTTIGADTAAMRAFCLHPLIQEDQDYAMNIDRVAQACAFGYESTHAIVAAIEYRRVANAYLSNIEMPKGGIKLSPSLRVNQMLIADKVQNKKDFEKLHKASHPRSERLSEYFKEWIDVLGIESREAELTALISPCWAQVKAHAKEDADEGTTLSRVI